MRHHRTATLCAVLLFLVLGVNGLAQNVEERLEKLESANDKLRRQNERIESQNAEILQRLHASEQRNAELSRRLADAERRQDDRTSMLVDGMGAILDDLERGGTTGGGYGGAYGGGMTRSGFALQFYGVIRLEAAWNDSRFNRVIDPQWVRTEDGIFANQNDDQFNMNLRRTTLGMNADVGRVGDARVRGKLEFDFAGFDSEAENRAQVRLLLAYIDFEIGDFSIRVGQDWDIVAPLDPIVDNQRHLWDTGNLGDRRPLIQAFYDGGDRSGLEWSVGVAVGLTGAVDNQDADVGFGTFLSTEIDGFDSGHPHVQLAANVSFDSWVAGERISLGVSGAYGVFETDTRFNGENHFETWLISFDVVIPLFPGAHIKAEGFMGQALADFRGGISQSLNPTTGDEIDSIGGFGEFYWQVDDFFGFGLGASIDNPDFDDLDLAMRASNWTAYLAGRFDWGHGVRSGFDVIFWKTQYADREEGDALRVTAFVELSF